MKKILYLGGIALVATGAAALAWPAPDQQERGADVSRQQVIDQTAQRFVRLDLDGDGTVTTEEMKAAHRQRREQHSARMFERMDLGRDGQISRAEFDQVRSRMEERRGERRRRAMAGQAVRGGARAGDRSAGNPESLTLEQMQERALARFDRLDPDRDGRVTSEERRSAGRHRRQHKQD